MKPKRVRWKSNGYSFWGNKGDACVNEYGQGYMVNAWRYVDPRGCETEELETFNIKNLKEAKKIAEDFIFYGIKPE